MNPESRALIEKLLRQELANLERDRGSADLRDAYDGEATLARIGVLSEDVRRALAEITGTPTDDL